MERITIRVTIDEAAAHLEEMINKMMNGEEVIIIKNDQEVAQLAPLSSQRRKPGSAKGMVFMSDDFDDPLPDFDEYLA